MKVSNNGENVTLLSGILWLVRAPWVLSVAISVLVDMLKC